ncbi:MAG: DNA recombination protein RmuC [Maricaulaceae bacterium]
MTTLADALARIAPYGVEAALLGAAVVSLLGAAFWRSASRARRHRRSLRTQLDEMHAAASVQAKRLTALDERREIAERELAVAQNEAARVGPLEHKLDDAERRVLALEASLRETRARAQADAEHAAREKADLLDLQRQLENKFKTLAADAFRANEERFLNLASETLKTHQAETRGGLAQHQERLTKLLEPVGVSFDGFKKRVDELEASRIKDREGVMTSMRHMHDLLNATRKETERLRTALQSQPQTRGRWAEEQLKNILELAGMAEHTDFDLQSHMKTETGGLRPDCVIRVPGGGSIVVDAKVSLNAYLDAVDADDPEARQAAFLRHAKQLRTHVKQLADKAYWKQFRNAPDFVAMFVPGDQFFAAALDCDEALFSDALEKRVVIVTPSTLVALAKVVAFGWRQQFAYDAAQDIAAMGKDFYERVLNFASYLNKSGEGLKKAVNEYNKAVGSLQTRLLPKARQLRDTKAFTVEYAEQDPIDAVTRVDETPRLCAPEVAASGADAA